MSDSTYTRVVFGNDARKQLFKGLDTAAQAVTVTLGPSGKTVVIQNKSESPIVTKDGVTVSKMIRLKDPIERMGAELIREAAVRTNDIAGDGTTTSTVLTHSMVKEGLKLLEAGFTSLGLCKGIEKATSVIIQKLKDSSVQLKTSTEVAQVGTISANGDVKIGELISLAMEKVGRDGIITVEDAKGMSTTLEIVEGMKFERGYLSPYFVTNQERMTVSYENAYVLVTDKKLSTLKDLIPLLEKVVQSQRPLLIIAEEVDGDAIQGLVLNRVKSNLPVAAIKAPGYGGFRDDMLKDICVLTGAKLVSSSTGAKLTDEIGTILGTCKKFVIDAKSTVIVGTGATKDSVSAHVENLREQLTDISLLSEEVSKLKMRTAKLASGVAVVKVGGATEIEMVERKYRIEDALNATRAAAEEGIVPGGGIALFNIVKNIMSELETPDTTKDEEAGFEIVIKSCMEPLSRIVVNAGQNAGVILSELRKRNGEGYNAATGEYGDMISFGVIDPVKVTRTALEHAASVAITFLSLDAVVYEDS